MSTIFYDSTVLDDARRDRLYHGDVFIYRPQDSTRELCNFAKSMIEEAFHPFDPEHAQDEMEVERYAALLADLKPSFIHHPETKRLLQRLLVDLGCDDDRTYFDVPRLRSSTYADYLTTGIAYAFHPHRDTWYSSPASQLNWWLPIYDLEANNGLAFHPMYWSTPIKNSSRHYNYAEWNRTSRFDAARHIGVDTRVQPKAEESVDHSGDIRPVCNGASLILFSGAQLHSSVQNTSSRTRFSIDFRTVHLDEVVSGRGAPNLDSSCTGTTLGDVLRLRDLAPLPSEMVQRYEEGFGRDDPSRSANPTRSRRPLDP